MIKNLGTQKSSQEEEEKLVGEWMSQSLRYITGHTRTQPRHFTRMYYWLTALTCCMGAFN